MAQTPAKIGTLAPSTSVICAARNLTIAWAAVNRTVCIATSLSSGGARPFNGAAPCSDQPAETRRHVADRGFVVDSTGKPRRGGIAENGPADGKAFYGGRVGGDRKAPREFLFRRLEAQQHNAAT